MDENNLYLPHADIYKLLSSLGCDVSQAKANVFNVLPAITYRVDNVSPSIDLDNTIEYQKFLISVDVWSKDSIQALQIAKDIEKLMRGNGYDLEFFSDVPNMEPNLYHVTLKFKK